MKALVNCFLLSLSMLACSRQPVGVAVSPTAPAPVPPANEVPLPDPEVQRALEERAEEETVTTTPAPVGIPPTNVLPEEVTVYDNQTP